MSEHKFTPGPWRLGRCGAVVADTPVPEVGGSDCIEYYGGHLVCESVTPSNARLIAAAPDLLAELENIANAKRGNFESDEEFRLWAQNRARHAIAKALGGYGGSI